MKVAKKSPARRRTLTLPLAAFPLLDRLRGEISRSAYVEGLLERETIALNRSVFMQR